ncbi:hypothetical protein MY10362_009653 [Beauveria mimosiformis]
MGLRVTALKIDPYLNTDAGLLNPQTVQVVPRITDAIQEGIERYSNTHVDDSDEAPDSNS